MPQGPPGPLLARFKSRLQEVDDQLAQVRGTMGLPKLNSATWIGAVVSNDKARQRISTELPKALNVSARILGAASTGSATAAVGALGEETLGDKLGISRGDLRERFRKGRLLPDEQGTP